MSCIKLLLVASNILRKLLKTYVFWEKKNQTTKFPSIPSTLSNLKPFLVASNMTSNLIWIMLKIYYFCNRNTFLLIFFKNSAANCLELQPTHFGCIKPFVKTIQIAGFFLEIDFTTHFICSLYIEKSSNRHQTELSCIKPNRNDA